MTKRITQLFILSFVKDRTLAEGFARILRIRGKYGLEDRIFHKGKRLAFRGVFPGEAFKLPGKLMLAE